MKQKHLPISEDFSSPDANGLVEPTASRKTRNAVAKADCLVGWHTHNP